MLFFTSSTLMNLNYKCEMLTLLLLNFMLGIHSARVGGDEILEISI